MIGMQSGIVALLDMESFFCHKFYALTRELAELCAHPEAVLEPEGRDKFAEMLPALYAYCDELRLALSKKKLTEIYHKAKEGCSIPEISRLLREMDERIEQELESVWFFYIHRDKVRYLQPMGAVHDEMLESLFPHAAQELDHAGSCYALGEDTASVFHSMRALEKGLRSLAVKLEIPRTEFDFENWKNIIDKIEKYIRQMEEMPKGDAKSKALEFYSKLALNFRYFKDAWRNHAMHTRMVYGERESRRVLDHVFDFLCEEANGDIREMP